MQLEDLFDKIAKSGESEFHVMLCALQTLGIPYKMHWAPASSNEEFHRKALKDGGFNLSVHCLTGVCIGNQMYVFSTGKAHWVGEHEGRGPNGAFLYVMDMEKNEIVYNRLKYLQSKSEFNWRVTGVHALASQYDFKL